MSFKSIDSFNLNFEVDLVSMTAVLVKDGKQGRAYDAGQYFQYFVEYGVRKADVVQLKEHFSIDYFQNLLVTGKESELFEFCVKFVGEDYKILQCKMKPVESQNNSIIKIVLEDISHKRVQQLNFIKKHFAQDQYKSDAKFFDIKFEEADADDLSKEKWHKYFIHFIAVVCLVLSFVFFKDVYLNNLNKTAEENLSSCQNTSQYMEQQLNFNFANLEGFRTFLLNNRTQWNDIALFEAIDELRGYHGYETIVFVDENGKFISTCKDTKQSDIEYLISLIGTKLEDKKSVITEIIGYETFINCAIPIDGVKINGKEYSTMMVIYIFDNFCNDLQKKLVDKKQDSIFINDGGDILWSSRSQNSLIINQRNIFDYFNKSNIKVEDDEWEDNLSKNLKSNTPGTFAYLENGQRRFVTYCPLSTENLYLLSVSRPEHFGFEAIKMLLLVISMWFMLMLIPILIITSQTRAAKKERQHLEELAYIDDVTGGKNVNCFKVQACPIIREMEWHYALVVTNLQNFSIYNKKYGNVRGDEIIRQIFLEISKYIDEEEVVCRAYAEHMMILMKYEGEKQLNERLVAIGKSIIETNFKMEFGVCVIRDSTMDLEVAIERANIALGNNKNKKISNVIISYYDVNLLERILFEKELENTMYNAFRKGELEIFVEPRYDINTRALCNGDAYAVWNHPEKGVLEPKQYESVFERRGLIIWLDSFIFEKICITIREHLDNGRSCLPITIKLHRNHFNISDFLNKFIKIKDKYDIPGQCLCFEISEETMCEKLGQIEKIIDSIHKMKSVCILGEYKGTFLPVEILSRLDIDAIKFAPGLIEGDLSQNVVKALINLGKAMELRVVATGVENQAEILRLSSYGCNEAKGDVFAKNISLQEYINII
ncbi:MAG: EAL domain-containing protein [Aminipila sp.]